MDILIFLVGSDVVTVKIILTMYKNVLANIRYNTS